MSFDLTPITRTETELGCVVETRRQTNAHGLLIEHVALSCPDPEPTYESEEASSANYQ